MANPVGWPPRPHSSTRSIRFYQFCATTTSLFSDNAYLFASGGANSANTFSPLPNPGSAQTVDAGTLMAVSPTTVVPSISGTGRADRNPQDASLPPVAMVWSMGIRIANDGAVDIEYSFDGTNVHGRVKAGEVATYFRRHEAGIAVRTTGASSAVRIEAW
jgi:hypothetical protein